MIIALSDGGLGLRMSGILPTLELRSRIKKVPFFIRPLVLRRAEAVTRERGLEEVTSQLLEKRQCPMRPADDSDEGMHIWTGV